MKIINTNPLLALLAGLILILGACSSEDAPGTERNEYPDTSKGNIERTPIQLSENTRAVAEDLKNFYATFTTDVARYIDLPTLNSENGNFVCSPLGACMIFGMAANGLEEEAKSVYADYLGVKSISDLNQLALSIMEKIPLADITVKSKLTNSTWLNTTYNLDFANDFANEMKKQYLCELKYANFFSPNFKEELDKWGKESSEGVFRNFPIEVIETSFSLFANVLYFNAPWRNEIFNKSKTRKAAFYGATHQSEVDMMESEIASSIISDSKDFSLFTLLFGNGAYSFNILLPAQVIDMDVATSLLTPQLITSLKENGHESPSVVRLPKFEVETILNINPILTLNGNSDLLKSYKIKAFIPEIEGVNIYNQATAFSINEKGVEGAAISTDQIIDIAGSEQTIRNITIDRPFFFFIEEYSTGTCLLSGRITDL